jgi:2-polyprenyl-3-methyl-5-hydroxy-6-metoxy-1,4-benzoquinol methylase
MAVARYRMERSAVTVYDLKSVDPDAANTSHALVLELVGGARRVLDVGCSTGYLGRVLAERGCVVDGVEIDPEAARLAREHLHAVIEIDLDDEDLAQSFPGCQYDCIVLADVLEHLVNPRAVLESAVSLLAPDGAVVISVPNVTHGSVRLALLQGRWDYRDTGLLDRTHIRFFTRESILDLVRESGLAVIELRSTVVDPLSSEVELNSGSLPKALVGWVRAQTDSFNYQFVIRAKLGLQEGKIPAVDPAAHLPEMDETYDAEATFRDLDGFRNELTELRRHILTLRDHAIGAEVSMGTARAQVEAAKADLQGVLAELAAVKRSRTWRAGKMVLSPVGVLRRILHSQ